MMDDRTTLVVGAGLAGATCAASLASAGVRVTLVDKARGAGGRMSTRWRDDGAKFDHGAQCFRASSTSFAAELARWESLGRAARWTPHYGQGVDAHGGGGERFVGTPTMNAPVTGLVEDATDAGADFLRGTHVRRIEAVAGGWSVSFAPNASAEPATTIEADRIVVAAPAPQTASLLEEAAPSVARAADTAEFAPCWALMVEFNQVLNPGFTAARVPESAIAWVARESGKPGRAPGERWVLHATPEFSTQHLERTREQVTPVLLEAFAAFLGHPLPIVTHVAAHRWRYSLVTKPVGTPVLRSACRTLFAAGDWCLGGRVEAAWQSGTAAATAVLASFEQSAQ